MKLTVVYDFNARKVEVYGREGTDYISGLMYTEGDPGRMIEPFLKLNREDAMELVNGLFEVGVYPKDFEDKYIRKSALTVPPGTLIDVADTIGEREYLQTQLDVVMKQNSKLMDILLEECRKPKASFCLKP